MRRCARIRTSRRSRRPGSCFQLGVLWGETRAGAGCGARRARGTARRSTTCRATSRRACTWPRSVSSGATRDDATRAARAGARQRRSRSVLASRRRRAGRGRQRAKRQSHLAAARAGFEALLAKHPLAFADHGAEFYAGSGGDPARAFELARLNLANRPTLRAFEQAHATALAAGETAVAEILLARAIERWANTAAFDHSTLRRKVAAHAGT